MPQVNGRGWTDLVPFGDWYPTKPTIAKVGMRNAGGAVVGAQAIDRERTAVLRSSQADG